MHTARPLKDGIDYFPLDVGFMTDKKVKLIKAEFGAKGIVLLQELWAEIYRDNGYYKRWDDDDCLLMSEGVGCGCDPKFVAEVVQGCLRRFLFDEEVFKVFGVLTSAGIQRRYLRAVAERSNIEIFKEYFLLDTSNSKDVPEGILKRITFKSVMPTNNGVNLPKNKPKRQRNAQSKVEQSKEENSKVLSSGDDDCARTNEETDVFFPSTVQDGFMDSMNCFIGVTPTMKHELALFVNTLLMKYFGRKAAEADVMMAFHYVHGDPGGDGTLTIDADRKKLLELAFEAAHTAGHSNWNYINGVFRKFCERGIKNEDDYWDYEESRTGTE